MRLITVLVALLALTDCADEVAAPTTTSTAPARPAVEAVWEGTGFDLHGSVRVESTVALGVSTQPEVTDDGEALGSGLLTVWVDEATPQAVADLLAADCTTLPRLLDRWSDALYRLDVPEGHKAHADAYLGLGMERVGELGCDYEVDLEGRATPFG